MKISSHILGKTSKKKISFLEISFYLNKKKLQSNGIINRMKIKIEYNLTIWEADLIFNSTIIFHKEWLWPFSRRENLLKKVRPF